MKICTLATFVGLLLAAAVSNALETRQLRSSEQQTGVRVLAGDGIEETADDGWNVLVAERRRKLAGTLVRSGEDGERLVADSRRTTIINTLAPEPPQQFV
ncbi:hypothetical protein P3T76_002114 [Phytophthora citrophthora]|uniref:RxLR effector protein n=1 Tax=Phytophthora citrophthora TaxID=4793 RepID=A0AAD9GZ20_9STRA|nr:hypothetical protein P3T76_002114 [Phytophthora citrophthora]